MEEIEVVIKNLDELKEVLNRENGILSQLPNWLAASGTIVIAILAIWGESFRKKIAGPKLRIHLVDPKQERIITHSDGKRQSIYFHLKVKNKRKITLAKKVNVLINKVLIKRENSQKFEEHYLQDNFPIYRAYSTKQDPYYEAEPTIGPAECTFDIGHLQKENREFIIHHRLTNEYNKIALGPKETIKIDFVAVGENSRSKHKYVEINWNGEWPSDDSSILECFEIKEIKKM